MFKKFQVLPMQALEEIVAVDLGNTGNVIRLSISGPLLLKHVFCKEMTILYFNSQP